MSRSDLRTVASAAFSVSLEAKGNRLVQHTVDQLRATAEALLPEGHPLRLAVSDFATQYLVDRWDHARMIEHGDLLAHAVELALQPVPPDQERRDING